jgi:hypothetical protein
MNMTLSPGEWISLLGGGSTLFFGLLITLGRLLISQVEHRLDERFNALEVHRQVASQEWRASFGELEKNQRETEQRLIQLLIDLPEHYQRREDSIRQEVAIIHRLDALAGKVEQALQCDLHACPLHDFHLSKPGIAHDRPAV